jgi:Zn-dependent protease
MMVGGFGIGRWFGFRIRIDVSWFVVFALVTWTFASFELPHRVPGYGSAVYLALGAITALLLFLSVLLHELAHSAVARARGIPVSGITLFIFGGVAEMGMEARRPADEFVITAVGPLASFTLAGLFALLARIGPPGGVVAGVAGILAVVNLAIAIFNLIPAFPLDGGRILRAAVWRFTGKLSKATRVAAGLGRLFGWLIIGLGVLSLLQGLLLQGVWAALLGWFLVGAASASARQAIVHTALSGVTVREASRELPAAVPAAMSARELADRHLLPGRGDAFPVTRDGRIVGVVTLGDVAELGYEERDVPLLELMTPADEVPGVPVDAPLSDIVAGLRQAGKDRAFVVDAGRILGLLTLRGVSLWIERARELGYEPEAGGEGED